MEDLLYWYKAKLVRVIDGDTLLLDIDMGFRCWQHASCRLYGINAPELHGPSSIAGQRAKDHLKGLVVERSLIVRSEELDKFGRPLVKVFAHNAATDEWFDVNQQMTTDGQAVAYNP